MPGVFTRSFLPLCSIFPLVSLLVIPATIARRMHAFTSHVVPSSIQFCKPLLFNVWVSAHYVLVRRPMISGLCRSRSIDGDTMNIDEAPPARHAAHLVTKLPGGHGAVREVCDYLLAHSGPARPGHKARGR